jgi:acyl-coenzyme A synthetase/AMP-(fatty) acid ligase
MLYECWRQIARERSSEIALRELPSGRVWTFGKLAAVAEKLPAAGASLVCAQGQGAEFIFDVLCAWRDRAVCCALEAGQTPPVLPLPSPPAAHLKLTSATTGPARAVIFTAEQLAADAGNIVSTMGLRAEWPNLGVISMAHSYGFSNLVLPLLLHGIPLVIVACPLPEAVRTAARDLSALTLAAVPALWRTWHETGAIPPQTRLAISAGAPLAAALERDVFTAWGVKIHNFYGSTECGGIAYDGSDVPRGDDGCVGSAMLNVRLTANETGCLRVASRAVGLTYWPEGEATLTSGFFQTQDQCEFRDGLVFLRGRLGDQINVAGRKVWPAVIERLLSAHPAVRECVVFGLPSKDADRSEIIAAAVVVRQPVAVAELKQMLLAHLPAWQVPREWRLVGSLGENGRGKISRAEWRRNFLAKAGQP